MPELKYKKPNDNITGAVKNKEFPDSYDSNGMKEEIKRYFGTRLEGKSTLGRLYKTIKRDLDQVEDSLRNWTQSSNMIISDISSYLFQKSGKRIRPAILLLCAKLLGYDGKEHIHMSALVESIHTASLLHDDIIDNSDVRRGNQTVHAKWGPNITVLLGDYLYIKTLGSSLDTPHREIIRILTDVSAEMIDGELQEYSVSGNLGLEESKYLEILSKKTASLFAASGHIAAVLAGAGKKGKKLLTDFGNDLGMSFQLIDDLLDFSGDEKKLGKPILSDLSEKRITLPLIYTIKNADRDGRKRLSDMLERGSLPDEAKADIISMVKSNGALKYTFQKATEYSENAKKTIRMFPESIYRDTLALICDFVLNRSN